MRNDFGSLWPIVASTPSTFCAGLALPWSTAPVSSVRRCGKYHSLPSTLVMPAPASMPAQRSMGVIAPALDQPAGLTFVLRWPRWAWAANNSLEVFTSVSKPNVARLVAATGGLSTDGVSAKDCDDDGALGAMSAAVDPTAENSPSSGAGTPLKASHGVPLASVESSVRAADAVTGWAELPPSS